MGQRTIVVGNADKLRKIAEKAAKERQREAGKEFGRGKDRLRPSGLNLSEPEPPKKSRQARDDIGAALGISGRQVQRGVKIVESGAEEVSVSM